MEAPVEILEMLEKIPFLNQYPYYLGNFTF